MLFQQFKSDHGRNAMHGDQDLTWLGYLGDELPVRGNATTNRMLRPNELADLPLELTYHNRMFQLWKPQDKAEFDEVNRRIVSGWFQQRVRHDHFVPEQQHYMVWLEWVQLYRKGMS